MMRPLFTYRFIAIASGLLFCVFTAEAARSAAVSAAPLSSVSVSEDPGPWRRDPFIGGLKKGVVPPAAKGIQFKSDAGVPKQEQDIRLQGIMQADKTFHAMINGRSVKVGDKIGGVTIKKISRFRVVVLSERNEEIIYDIYQGRIDRGKK